MQDILELIATARIITGLFPRDQEALNIVFNVLLFLTGEAPY